MSRRTSRNSGFARFGGEARRGADRLSFQVSRRIPESRSGFSTRINHPRRNLRLDPSLDRKSGPTACDLSAISMGRQDRPDDGWRHQGGVEGAGRGEGGNVIEGGRPVGTRSATNSFPIILDQAHFGPKRDGWIARSPTVINRPIAPDPDGKIPSVAETSPPSLFRSVYLKYPV